MPPTTYAMSVPIAMPRKPSAGRPNQPRVRLTLSSALTPSTVTMTIAGVTVSPAPRRQALPAKISVLNGSENARMRRYSSASVRDDSGRPVSRAIGSAKTNSSAAEHDAHQHGGGDALAADLVGQRLVPRADRRGR